MDQESMLIEAIKCIETVIARYQYLALTKETVHELETELNAIKQQFQHRNLKLPFDLKVETGEHGNLVIRIDEI